MDYLLLLKKGINVNIEYFWAIVIVLIIALFYQIIKFDGTHVAEVIVLFEVVIMSMGLLLMYAMPHDGLFSHDPHWDYSVVKAISEYGWPLPSAASVVERTRNLAEWPLLHILTIIVSEIALMDSIVVAKYLPVVITSLTTIFFYLIIKNSYKDTVAALLGTLAFCSLFWHTFFHSLFIRETIAFMFFIMIIYILSKRQDLSTKIIFIVAIVAVAFSHHLTCFILILFSLFLIIGKYFLTKLINTNFLIEYKKDFHDNKLIQSSNTSFLFITTSILAYWIYIGGFTFKVLEILQKDLLYSSYGSYSLNHYFTASARMMLGSYGNILFVLLISISVLYSIIKGKGNKSITDIIFLVWGGLIVTISYMSTYLMPRIEFSRFILFGYPFLIISATAAIVKFKKPIKYIYILFVAFQLFLIPPYLYNNSFAPEYEYGKYREYFLPEEYIAASWFKNNVPLKNKVVGDWTSFELFGSQQFNVYHDTESTVQIFKGNLEGLDSYSWLILRNEDFYSARVGKPRATNPVVVTKETFGKFNEDRRMIKVYDNKEIMNFKIN
ncbi:hypothetical protein [Pelotomaculum sp. FP]|uniref:hypothetical protein n=1 Tax=Pelotomaculum sp. FP TaxID=261474 RepID=UPI0018640D93|nr:hypothetical protein [Pelotomaculum sp. FP]